MKIWLVTGDLFDQSSGPYAVVKDSAEEYVRQGCSVTVIGSHGDKQNVTIKYPCDLVSLKRYFLDSMHFTPSIISYLSRIDEKQYPDLVEIHGVWLINAWIIAYWCFRKKIKYSIFVHGNLNEKALSISKLKKHLSLKLYGDKFLFRASCFQALNNNEKDSIESYIQSRYRKTTKVFVEGNGVRYHDEVAQGHDFLFLGRLHPIKNIESLIVAFSKLPNEKLIIAGDGDSAYVNSLVKLASSQPNQGNIEFFGFANDEDKANLFSRAKAFILPSYSEGQPVAALEAMSYGIPLLLSNKCNLPAVDDKIMLFEPNPDSLFNSLRNFLSTSDSFSSLNIKDYCFLNYSWATIIKNKIKIYSEMIND